MRSIRRRAVALVAPLLACLVLAGCGLGTSGGFTRTGHLAGPMAGYSLAGSHLVVGSKNFNEAVMLGKMTVILLRSAGADVTDYTNIPGSSSARQAQVNGQTDLMWDYTGTAWISYLGQTDPLTNSTAQYEAVRDLDQREHQITWLPPAPLDNNYSFVVTRAVASKYGLKNLSDLAKVPEAERTYCVESEFANRNDGFQPMLKAYDVPAPPPGAVKTLDAGAIYQATSDGLCTFGEAYTTDGRISALDLVALADDRSFFPKYNASLAVRDPVLAQHPQLAPMTAQLTPRLTNAELIELNKAVDVDGRDPGEVAWEWLVKEGLVTP